MEFAALIIGALLLVSAFNNSYSQLVAELETDIPGFFKWGAAIVAILALGYLPGMKTPTRWLLALVLVVLVVKNYQQILSGFTTFSQASPTPTSSGAAASPSASYVATYAPAAAGATSTSSSAATTAAANTAVTQGFAAAGVPAGLNPGSYLAAFGV